MQLITEECVHKLDTKQQTNALLNLVWRDSASEEVFTMMASICHTLMVQHRLMVPKVRYRSRLIYLGIHNMQACNFNVIKPSISRELNDKMKIQHLFFTPFFILHLGSLYTNLIE